jgi:uncharacterized protein YbbK (DUF523 family)
VKPKKVAVSACLLGQFCRYDGTTKRVEGLQEALQDMVVIPFCPEAPPLGTPRGRISVIRTEEGYRLWRDEDGEDVTELIEAETKKLIEEHPDLEMIILKSKSPSCGLGTTPILNEKRQLLHFGNGIATQLLRVCLPGLEMMDETRFER